MTLTQLQIDRQSAQSELLTHMMVAFCETEELTQQQQNQLEKQARRVEALFGFVPGSFQRGA